MIWPTATRIITIISKKRREFPCITYMERETEYDKDQNKKRPTLYFQEGRCIETLHIFPETGCYPLQRSSGKGSRFHVLAKFQCGLPWRLRLEHADLERSVQVLVIRSRVWSPVCFRLWRTLGGQFCSLPGALEWRGSSHSCCSFPGSPTPLQTSQGSDVLCGYGFCFFWKGSYLFLCY